MRGSPLADSNLRNPNPLWIIALFLSLTEATIGISASQAHGWVQGLWAIFSVAFPTAVAAVFFVFLWKKPFVFYAPRDFSVETPVGVYVAAMGPTGKGALQAVEETVRSAINTALTTVAVVTDQSAASSAVEIHQAVESIVASATEDYRSKAIEIDISGISPKLIGEDPMQFFADGDTSIQRLTDQVYFRISGYVRPYRYGKEWVLEDARSGKRYENMGKQWAGEHLGVAEDTRLLSEVGIVPGARLTAVRVHRA